MRIMPMVNHRRHIAAKHPLDLSRNLPYRTKNVSSIAARRLAACLEGFPAMTDSDREREIQEYMCEFERLTPEQQKIHYSVVLTWIYRALTARQVVDKPPTRRLPQQGAQGIQHVITVVLLANLVCQLY